MTDTNQLTIETDEWTPVSYENCEQVSGPFFHGTKASLAVGDLLRPGHPCNFEEDRALKHIYFAARMEAAIWGAELATSLSGLAGRGYIYVVEPTGQFEDDPNVTNKRFPGNPTRSYRTHKPLKIVGMVDEWDGHTPEELQAMLDSLANLRSQGLAVIVD
ncbi:NAD(+)--rifampin ADP-ribosyltransferase [Microbulbifer spongiae]|uniref:NAD(+)--rifampin ADP-ribosyltransferase n=1 Tax=Microbulbifer spongiae TaxID=2944933 RepID=A0ABY9EAH9_9GAMM|nr:NAD(+)--rifampin ADP-ribosyltransferase [Microbulbifer sp. MI-G]WKD49677.1 NAD(+)--rifampin ADP-ribosyltransferase [Microbulbifer sp. MI-G]